MPNSWHCLIHSKETWKKNKLLQIIPLDVEFYTLNSFQWIATTVGWIQKSFVFLKAYTKYILRNKAINYPSLKMLCFCIICSWPGGEPGEQWLGGQVFLPPNIWLKIPQSKIICWSYIPRLSTSGMYRSRTFCSAQDEGPTNTGVCSKNLPEREDTWKQGVIILQKFLKNFKYGGFPQGALWMVSFFQMVSNVYPYHLITTAISTFMVRGPMLPFTAVPPSLGQF